MLKKATISILISFLLLFGIFQSKANASVVIGGAVIGGSWISHPLQGLVATVIATPIATAGVIVGAFMVFLNPIPGVSIMILSEEKSLHQQDLESVLSQKYSFINDRAVISDLANLIKKKSDKELVTSNQIQLSISEDEIKSIFSATDLLEVYPNEMSLLIKDLK